MAPSSGSCGPHFFRSSSTYETYNNGVATPYSYPMTATAPNEMNGSKTFILGLDGVPWDYLNDWVNEEEFPNFHRVMSEGATGLLRSTTPAVTPLAWPSITTGAWPDKHGVYGFQKLTADHTQRMYTNADVEQPSLWEIVPSSVACNVPVTYPATEIDGTLVAGTMTPTMDDEYTSPPELSDEIAQEIPNHRISLRWGDYLDRREEFVDEIGGLVESRRQLLEFLESQVDDWRLFFFTVMAPDRLQHLVWDEAVLKDHYRRLDALLGDVLSVVEAADANLFVVSDHGFGPVSKTVCVNHILEANGYLTRQENATRSLLQRAGVTKDTLKGALNHVGIDEHDLVKNYLPRPLVNRVASNVPGSHTVYDIDPDRTQALVHGKGNVYINAEDRFEDGSVPESAVEPLKRELERLFSSYADPETGRRPLEVHDGDDLFPTDSESPDLVVEPSPDYAISSSLTSEPIKEPSEDADHRKNGIFFAWGPDVRTGASLEGLSVVDVAPTVLHGFGLPIPERTDGRVVDELFREGSAPDSTEVTERAYSRHSETSRNQTGDMDRVKDRLQGLGYMDS